MWWRYRSYHQDVWKFSFYSLQSSFHFHWTQWWRASSLNLYRGACSWHLLAITDYNYSLMRRTFKIFICTPAINIWVSLWLTLSYHEFKIFVYVSNSLFLDINIWLTFSGKIPISYFNILYWDDDCFLQWSLSEK